MLRAGLPLLCALSACQYDYGVLYEHVDAGPDTGMDQQMLMSQQLISAWIGHLAAVDEACVRCAEERCADFDGTCRGDPDCVAYTKCVGETPNPAGLTACRAQFSAWVRAANVRERDLAGPYGQCVFRDRCAVECGSNADLSCLGKYSWSTAVEPNVPLHLYLANPFDSMPAVGVDVRVCMESACPSNAPVVTSDASGLVELSLPTTNFARAFNGFLELTDPQIVNPQIVKTLLKFSWNIASESTQIVNVVPVAPGAQNLDRGMLQLRMFGCGGLGLRGVSFEASDTDAQSQTWYYDNGLRFDATETGSVGSGGITNVKVERTATEVTAVRRAGDTTQMVAKTTAPVRAGFMTVVIFVPGGAQ